MTQQDAAPVPYDEGMLDVGDGNQVYWQVRGTPGGKPATDMRHNTTQRLVADMERLREHLGIERWLLNGYSWGTALSLAYAEQHPERVSEIILAAIYTARRRDVDWLYRDAARFYPEAFERFCAGAGVPRDGDILGAYARLTEDPDPAVREKATADWCAWEDALLSHEPQGKLAVFSGRPQRTQLALVRICAHYASHGMFLEDGALIRDAGRLAGIPGMMAHGRLDMNGPLEGAWELAKAWPDAELLVAEDAGHLDSDTKVGYIFDAIKRFASRSLAGPTEERGGNWRGWANQSGEAAL
ncbi:MAG TPA: alpha/beta fold hydrolase [Streptosporangiaceae bacterium]|jgi:proline iminopeptidase